MVGTEQGLILACNRKAKNPGDRVGASFAGHHGPVRAVRRRVGRAGRAPLHADGHARAPGARCPLRRKHTRVHGAPANLGDAYTHL